MQKGSLKSRIDGNSLDLSLSELTEPPVKELAELTKAVKLDLSCNKIAVLPDAFCTLTHLKEVDLSKNQLKELPANFGKLNNVQKLDLYSNSLSTLPLSMCRMKNLRWLDLKGNPLEPRLKAVAGDCLNEKQCQQCAKKVVEYLQAQASDLEREKQKRLKLQREQEAARKAQEEKEAEIQRLEKKVERERKKAEQRLKRLQEHGDVKKSKENNDAKVAQGVKQKLGHDTTKKAKRGCCYLLLNTIFTLFVVLLSLFTAPVAYSFYKHKYPLTWPQLQIVLDDHWSVLSLQLSHGANLTMTQLDGWFKDVAKLVQSRMPVQTKE